MTIACQRTEKRAGMNVHKNAKLTPRGRAEIVRRVDRPGADPEGRGHGLRGLPTHRAQVGRAHRTREATACGTAPRDRTGCATRPRPRARCGPPDRRRARRLHCHRHPGPQAARAQPPQGTRTGRAVTPLPLRIVAGQTPPNRNDTSTNPAASLEHRPPAFTEKQVMNRPELCSHVAARPLAVEIGCRLRGHRVFETIAGALASGETVTIAQFGTFTTRNRPAREGRNPRTGETIAIAASRTPRSSPATRCAMPSTGSPREGTSVDRTALDGCPQERSALGCVLNNPYDTDAHKCPGVLAVPLPNRLPTVHADDRHPPTYAAPGCSRTRGVSMTPPTRVHYPKATFLAGRRRGDFVDSSNVRKRAQTTRGHLMLRARESLYGYGARRIFCYAICAPLRSSQTGETPCLAYCHHRSRAAAPPRTSAMQTRPLRTDRTSDARLQLNVPPLAVPSNSLYQMIRRPPTRSPPNPNYEDPRHSQHAQSQSPLPVKRAKMRTPSPRSAEKST